MALNKIQNLLGYNELQGELDKIGDITTLQTTDKTNLVNASNETTNKIGILTNLQTTDKASLVGAINENTIQLAEITKVFIVVNGLTKDSVVDNSAVINQAINSLSNGGTVFIPEGTYYIDTVNRVKLKSNIRLVLHPNTVLKAIPSDVGTTSAVEGTVLQIYYVDNAQVINGTIEGDVLTHPNSTGQWNHGIKIFNSTNVYLENVKANRHLGDGFYLDHGYSSNVKNENIVFNNCQADGNNRNGFSILAGKNIKLINPISTNQVGVAPGAGIDIEIGEYTLNPIAENIVIQNPTTKNNLVGITGRWDGCNGQDVTVTIENHYDDSSTRNLSFYNNMDVNIGGEIKVLNPKWLNAKSSAFVAQTYRSSNAKITIQSPYIKNPNKTGYTTLQDGSCFYLIGHTSVCGNVGIYNPTIVDDRGTPVITSILHAMDSGSFDKLEFHNPVSLPSTTQRPLFVSGVFSLKDERELLKYSSTWYDVVLDGSYQYPIFTNQDMVTYAYIRFSLNSTAPIGREIEFRLVNNKRLNIVIPNGQSLSPSFPTATEIQSTQQGASIKIKKIDSTTWTVIKMTGTWTVAGGLSTTKSGTLTYSGDGIVSTKIIPHGLVSTPTFFQVIPSSADAGTAGIKFVTADATNLTVTFNTTPITGTNNVKLTWKAEV